MKSFKFLFDTAKGVYYVEGWELTAGLAGL
jgi:hypothetical protein